MTEANNDSCNLEGEKDDRRIDDLFVVCVVEDIAGLAAEEIFEATPLGFFETPMAKIESMPSIEGVPYSFVFDAGAELFFIFRLSSRLF